MKNEYTLNFIKLSALFCLIALLIISSCQKESSVEINESEEENLTESSNLRIMLHNISLHDGSFDDHIDGANCFSIIFPYTLLVDEEEVTVASINDISSFIQKTAMLKLKFPVTIANSKHEVQEVTSQEMLESLAEKCSKIDDDIECIDVQYPITVATFNTQSENLSTITINHDRDLYGLTLTTILSSKLSIQYPIVVKTKDGELISIGHNEELEQVIVEFAGSCDEDD